MAETFGEFIEKVPGAKWILANLPIGIIYLSIIIPYTALTAQSLLLLDKLATPNDCSPKENIIIPARINIQNYILATLVDWNLTLINFAASNPQALIITIIIYTLAYIHIYLVKPFLSQILPSLKSSIKKPKNQNNARNQNNQAPEEPRELPPELKCVIKLSKDEEKEALSILRGRQTAYAIIRNMYSISLIFFTLNLLICLLQTLLLIFDILKIPLSNLLETATYLLLSLVLWLFMRKQRDEKGNELEKLTDDLLDYFTSYTRY